MTVSEIRLAAMNVLARREHSVAELRHKLFNKFTRQNIALRKEIDEELDEELEAETELVISGLIEDNLLNDERFTQMFVNSRVSRGFGPIKIAYELSQKEVAQDIIEAQLYREPEVWLEHMQRLQRKKFGESMPQDLKAKNRQYRYLYQRGYSSEQIKLILN